MRKKTASAHSYADVVRRRDPADINAAAQRLTIFQKGNIENRLLENNLAYARKLADTTDRYLVTAQRSWPTAPGR